MATTAATVTTERAPAPRNLSDLLGPLGVAEFLSRFWGKEFCYISGARGRFGSLLPWKALNRILAQHRLEPPRLRLAREGKVLDASSFVQYYHSKRRRFERVPRVLPAELTAHLRQGATLVLDAVDELHEPVTALAEALERRFEAHVQVNAYAGWRSSAGFDLHWDDHEVIVLQVAGRKSWKVYGASRLHPLSRDLEENKEPPESVVWEGMLNDGDLLYIPRGWWHVATPVDEPTLHLTIGISNQTGVDLLRWITDQLRRETVVRQDLPRFATPDQQAQHLGQIFDALKREWRNHVLDRFFASTAAMTQGRPHFGFPWSAADGVLPPNDDALVQLTSPRNLDVQGSAGDPVEFECNRRTWQFVASTRPIFDAIRGGEPRSIAALTADAAPHLSPRDVRALLRELVILGLVSVRRETD